MHCNISIMATSSSYDIFPIEEKDESEEEFVPYDRQEYKLKCQVIDSLHNGRSKSEHSQSYDNKEVKPRQLVRLRAKSLNQSRKKGLSHTNSLHIGSQKYPLPQIIHSSKHCPVGLQKESSSKKKLTRLQADMKQHRPAFFKEKDTIVIESANIAKRLNLQVLTRSNVFLFEISSRSKEELRELPISKKELRKMLQVQRKESAIRQQLPPKLARKLFSQI